MSSEIDGIEQVIYMLLIGCAVLDYVRVIQYVILVRFVHVLEKDKIVKSQWFEQYVCNPRPFLDYITPSPLWMIAVRVLSSVSMSVEYITCIQWIVVSSAIALHPIRGQSPSKVIKKPSSKLNPCMQIISIKQH